MARTRRRRKFVDAVRPWAEATWNGMNAAGDWVLDAFYPDVVPVKVRAAR
jgi:hypothetical protein